MKCPNQVESMVLLSPTAVAQGSDWSDMEINVMKFNAKKGGWVNFLYMGMASLAMILPFQSVADYGARQLMKRTMKNYYVDPNSAPEPASSFLSGVSAYACIETKNAFIRDVTTPMVPLTSTPCLGIFGDCDIYSADRVVSFCEQNKFTSGQTHVIRNCDHLVWVDQPKELVRLLSSFYAKRG
jgi:pimeloyl-ACP methyl ester carboxylesterase